MPPPSEVTPSSAPVLRLRGVVKGYAEGDGIRPVLDGVDLDLAPASVTALVGPSGSGKSTLLNVVSGIDRPDAGTVELQGTPFHALSERDRTLARRDRIGFIFQFFNLVPTLTVLENLLLPLELAGRGGAGARERARELLGRVGLADREGAWPDRLSGGEQQRVAVARALVHAPALILADEPTGNLDAAAGGRVLELLEGLVRAEGATLLMVTHAEEVAARADRVLELRGGKLRERPGRAAGDAPA
jgi:putative ABC transport system ATP-binding protein